MATQIVLNTIGAFLLTIGGLGYFIRSRIIEKLIIQYYRGKEDIDNRYMPNLYGGYTFDTPSFWQGVNPVGIQYSPLIPILALITMFTISYGKPPTGVIGIILIGIIYTSLICWLAGIVIRINLRKLLKPEILGRFYYLQNTNTRTWLNYSLTLVVIDSVAFALLGICFILYSTI